MGDLIALTRWVGPELATCELTHLGRAPIDTAAALAEHAEYLRALREFCDDVVELPALPEHPDGCFVWKPFGEIFHT